MPLALLAMGCTDFDTTRVESWRGTLGEEIYKIVCQRMASEGELERREADPDAIIDVNGNSTRDLCEGKVDPSTAPTPRLRALAENRDRLVAALDATLPEAMEDDLEAFMLELLPFYDPPVERLPTATREIATLLTHVMNDADASKAFERIGPRIGQRPLRMALGTARPLLAYDGLRDFLDTTLAVVGEGGAANDEWLALLEAVALEMATTVPDAPGEITTRDVGRDLLFAEHDAFASGTPLYLPLRDRRGLPIPTALDAPFVDLDVDGFADVDDKGRFVDASGVPLEVPDPFEVDDEVPATRDADGRALEADLSLLYQFRDIDRTFLAGVSRELLPLVDPSDPVGIDFYFGLQTMLGGETAGQEAFGAYTHDYTGLDTSTGPLFDVVHATGVLLSQSETDDLLALADVLLADHEALLGALIESGLVAQANGDLDPDAQLTPDQELWDDLIEVATIMAEDGILEDVLRLLAQPETRRLGQIYAELMRHTDTPAFDPANDRDAPPFYAQAYDEETVRETAGGAPVREWLPGSVVPPYPSTTPNNMSLFQESIGIIDELGEAVTCNKEGAYIYLPGAGDLINGILSAVTFGECGLLEIDDLAYFYARSITGRAHLNLNNGLLQGLVDTLNLLPGNPGDALVNSLISGMGIPGMTVDPTPEALSRLVFADPTETTAALLDPPETRDGDVVKDRFDPITVAWEREFCFNGEVLVDHADGVDYPCTGPGEESLTFFEAMTPLLNVLIDHKEAHPERPFLFTKFARALNQHWSSSLNTMVQSVSPAGTRYRVRSNGVSYEALTADLMADCGWNAVGPGRGCDPTLSAQFNTRLYDLMQLLDGIEVRPGVDGIAVLARASENMLVPALHPGLANRQGETTTFTNAGTREVDMSPMYLLLDALNAMDAAFAADADPTRHERWLSARSALVDQLMLTTPSGDGFVFANRRTHAILQVLVPFLQDRIAEHETLGDRDAWARGLGARLEASLGSAIGSSVLRLVNVLETDAAAEEQLLQLLEYISDPAAENDAFPITLLAIADLLQWLEDDGSIPPILNSLSEALATNAEAASLGTGSPDAATGAANRTIDFLREVNEVDVKSTLAAALANSVTLPPDDGATPLEVILDVIAEVNRATPGQGGSLEADDYVRVFQQTVDFLTDEDRGLERLYDVVQNREIP